MRRFILLGLLIAPLASFAASDVAALPAVVIKQKDEHFVSSRPASNDNVGSPQKVSIRFSKPVRSEGASIIVTDNFGTQKNDSDVTLHGHEMITTISQRLAPGRYLVKWHARCACSNSDDMSDSFSFTVR